MTERMLCATMLAERGFRVGAEGVGDDEFVGGADGLAHGAVGKRGLVGELFAFVVAAEGELHLAGFVAEKDVAALDLGEAGVWCRGGR